MTILLLADGQQMMGQLAEFAACVLFSWVVLAKQQRYDVSKTFTYGWARWP